MKKNWNWIDTSIIIVIILFVILFFNRGKILGSKNKDSTFNKKDIIFTVELDGIKEDMLTDLDIGDKIFLQNKLQDARVEKITIEPSDRYSSNKKDSYKYADELKAIVEIHGNVVSSDSYMELGGQAIKVGISFTMKTTKFEFPSKIKHIEVR